MSMAYSPNGVQDNNILANQDALINGISKSALRWVAASLSLILFAAIIGLSYSIGVDDADRSAIPIIRADGRAVKVRPENPGGRQYPHQDLVIYNSFRNDIAQKDPYLQVAPEKPLELSSPVASKTDAQILEENGLKLMTVSEDNTNSKLVMIDDVKSETKQDAQEIQEIIKSSSLRENKLNVNDTNTKSTDQVNILGNNTKQEIVGSNITKKEIVNTVQTKLPFLQIGSFRSKADALTALKRAQKKYTQLSGINHIISRADLGAKGTYYRLKVGPFENKKSAKDTCTKLKSQGQACLYTSVQR